MKPRPNPLMRLQQRAQRVAEQKVAHRDWYQISTPTQAADPTRVQIYGYIGDWWEGTDAATLARDIAALVTDQIEVHLNSPGGLAFDGIAIYNALRQHSADVTVVVDGLAASAASIIAMAGDTVVMSLGAQMMIHDASGLCWGNTEDMRVTAAWLDKLSQSGAEIYAAKAGGTPDEWRQAMLAESWYTAQEAVDAGLADQVDSTSPAEDPEQAFDLSVFAHAGRSQATAPALRAHQPPATPADTTTTSQTGAGMPDTFLSSVRERLGVTDANADEATVLAALTQTLAEQAEPTTDATTAGSVPAGMVLIDQGVLDGLQTSQREFHSDRDARAAADREQLVQAALADGRITAGSADHFRATLADDDRNGTTSAHTLLASMPKNAAVPVTTRGYEDGPEMPENAAATPEAVRNTDAYKNWSM